MKLRLFTLAVLCGELAFAQNLGQGWPAGTAQAFWSQDQGSMLMRKEVFKALRAPDGKALFIDGLASYGFIPGPLKDGLPIGFAIHNDKDALAGSANAEWVGLTCAACHTALWKYKESQIRVEGGPSMLDFREFFAGTVRAAESACTDETTFDALGQHALGYEQFCKSDTYGSLRRLQHRLNLSQKAVAPGFGRLDAFAGIFNQIADLLGNSPQTALPASAPVSYPFLWDIAYHKAVQWNGSAPNLGIQGTGTKLRNIGELLGIFGYLEYHKPDGLMPAYRTSANPTGLKNIEDWLANLYSPSWPASLPAPDSAMAKRGKELYEKHCEGCHQLLPVKTDRSHFAANIHSLDEVGTDPAMADHFRLARASSGDLQSSLKLVHPRRPWERFGQVDFLRDLTGYIAIGALMGTDEGYRPSKSEVLRAFSAQAWDGDGNIDGYKARPLNGIWATAPFLHNGSVPNLSELLKYPAERVAEFCVGTREFDPELVGYDGKPCNGSGFTLDTTKSGNDNQGHDYGAWLHAPEKKDLIEFLKTL